MRLTVRKKKVMIQYYALLNCLPSKGIGKFVDVLSKPFHSSSSLLTCLKANPNQSAAIVATPPVATYAQTNNGFFANGKKT